MSLPQIASYALPGADDLPAARAAWRVRPERCALLIHDMQAYFIRAFASGTSPIATVMDNLTQLARSCRSAGVPVFYSRQPGRQDPRDRGLQQDFWGPGMRSDAADRDIVAELAPQPGDIVLTKHRYSAFQRSNLEHLLRARGCDQLLIGGVYGHIGCLMTASDAFQRDIQPFLVADAIADFSRQHHDRALACAADCCALPLLTADLELLLS